MIGRVNGGELLPVFTEGTRAMGVADGPTARRVYVERLHAVPAFHLAGRDPEELLEKAYRQH